MSNIIAQESAETEEQIWRCFEKTQPIITPYFLATIPWECLGPCPSEDFAKALMIASDVETATYDVFFRQELAGTPSSRDPVITAFMKRWVGEELTHGDLLRKILAQWGTPHKYTPPHFGTAQRVIRRLSRIATNVLGERFKALHMIWGGINELTARETYRQLRVSTTDPVLKMILGAIIKEESLHAHFYLSIGALKLRAPFARVLCRMFLRTWRPVGGWNKSDDQMKPVLGLFLGSKLHEFHKNVTAEFERRLPALSGSGLTEILGRLVRRAYA